MKEDVVKRWIGASFAPLTHIPRERLILHQVPSEITESGKLISSRQSTWGSLPRSHNDRQSVVHAVLEYISIHHPSSIIHHPFIGQPYQRASLTPESIKLPPDISHERSTGYSITSNNTVQADYGQSEDDT